MAIISRLIYYKSNDDSETSYMINDERKYSIEKSREGLEKLVDRNHCSNFLIFALILAYKYKERT